MHRKGKYDSEIKDDRNYRIEVIERCACALAVHDGRIWKDMTRYNKDLFIERVKVVIKEYGFIEADKMS